MSNITLKTNGRRHLDQYFTHEALVSALLEVQPISGNVLEPCSGNGHITDTLHARQSTWFVITNDIDVNMRAQYHVDARLSSSPIWGLGTIDWVITNPPFNAAADILFSAWGTARVGVAMLLRMSFMEPTKKRGDWLQDHADHLRHFIPISQPRPSFTDNGKTDSVTTAWFVWLKDFSWKRDAGIPSPFNFVMRWRE
jgi:hypothetical protein